MREHRQGLVRRSGAQNLLPPIQQGPLPQRQISIGDIGRTVWKHKVAILFVTAIIFCAVAVHTFYEIPVYEGIARLQIDPTRSSNLGLDDGDKSDPSNAQSRVKTEVSIIQSDSVAIQVMKSLKLYANPHFAGNDVIKGNDTDLSRLDPAQRRLLLDRYSDSLTVRVIPDTEIIEIHFRSTDPIIAADAANSIIDEYMRRNFNSRVEGTAQISQWVSRQLDEIRASTAAAQEKLADFQREHNLLGSDESDNIVVDRLKQLNGELTQAEADRIVKEGRYRLALSGNPELIASVAPDSTLQVLHNQEAELEAELAQLSAKFGSGYPKVREVESQLAQIRSSISIEGGNIQERLANEYGAAAKAETMIRDNFDKQKEAAYKLNESAGQFAIFKHDVESGQQLYDALQLKLKEAGVTSGLSSNFIEIIDHAQVPDKPVEPRKMRNLSLGLGAGLFCGLLLALALDSVDDRIQSSESLETLTALPELGTIPFIGSLANSEKKLLGSDKLALAESEFRPLCVEEPNCMGAEAYRSLCSMILISSSKRNLQTIVVTSAVSNEGKSTVSCNLATALAQRGRRVLLVDADMRCSSIHTRFGAGPGLSTLLRDHTEYPVYRPLSQLPNLYVIPAGSRPTDTMELLDSTQLKKFMAAWKAEYDHIIIDTPPILPFSDALTLATEADGVILVARSGVSRTRALLRSREVLLRSGANVLGFVLNAVRRSESYYDYPSSYRKQINGN